MERTNRCANAFKFGDFGGSLMTSILPYEKGAERVGIFRVSVEKQMARAVKKSVVFIGDVPRDLHHPYVLRMSSDAGDVYGSGGGIDKEQDVICDQTLRVQTSTLRKSVAARHSQ